MGRVLLADLENDDSLESILDRTRFTSLTPRTIVARDQLENELARVRRQSWALVDQELERGCALSPPQAQVGGLKQVGTARAQMPA